MGLNLRNPQSPLLVITVKGAEHFQAQVHHKPVKVLLHDLTKCNLQLAVVTFHTI